MSDMAAFELEKLEISGVTTPAALAAFLDQLEAQLEQVQRLSGQWMFEKYTAGATHDMNQVDRLREQLLRNPDYVALVQRWLGQEVDPVLGARLRAWNRLMLTAHVVSHPDIYSLKNAITDRVIAFKPVVGGNPVDLSTQRYILRKESDRSKRQEAWEATAPLSELVTAETVELFRRRNRLAREAGYTAYTDLALGAEGLTKQGVLDLLDELEQLSAPAYSRLLGEGADRLGLEAIEPWDLAYLTDQQGSLPEDRFPRDAIIPRLHEFLRQMGLEPDRLPIAIHYVDIPFGGLCMSIAREDVRILMNPRDGVTYYGTMWHEYGHALHAALCTQDSFILRRDPSVFCEGMAQTLGYFTQDPQWLQEASGLPAADVEAYLQVRKASRLMGYRGLSAQVAFEYAAYDNPEQDLDDLRARTEQRYLGVAYNRTPRWAGSAFPSGYPIYYQNYILADVIASHTHKQLRAQFGSVTANPAVMAHLREQYWAPGALVDWTEKIERCTGQKLSSAALVAELV